MPLRSDAGRRDIEIATALAKLLTDRAGLDGDGRPKLSMHDLRHTAITHLIRQGADVGQVARFAGHARPSMTLDKYLHEFEALS